MRSGKRIVLLGVAGLLSASALLAIGILLAGRFGETEGRILGTTALLAGYGLIALPSTILLDQGRLARLSLAGLGLAGAGAALALAAVWSNAPEALGKAVGTATAFALALAQTSALAARRREADPIYVRRLFAFSCGLSAGVATVFAALLWAQIDEERSGRLLGALAVLDLLVVALQPILARTRSAPVSHRLRIVVEPRDTVVMSVEAADLSGAVAKAVRTLERDGRRVVRLDVVRVGADELEQDSHAPGTLRSPRDDPCNRLGTDVHAEGASVALSRSATAQDSEELVLAGEDRRDGCLVEDVPDRPGEQA